MRPERLWRYTPLLILLLTLGVAFWRLLRFEAFFWGLPSLQFVPWRAYGFDALRAGHLPLWNPYNGGGAPLMANYQSAFWYPLNWLGLLAPSYAALGWQMSITAVLHLFLAGVGMWSYSGRVGMGTLGRGVATLAFALTSYSVGRLGTYPIISVVAWLPWLLWALDGLTEQPNLRRMLWLAGFVVLILLGGHAQTAWYTLLLGAIYALWRLASVGRAILVARGVGYALLGLMLAMGIAAFQLVATADLLAMSPRSTGYGDEASALSHSYAPLRVLNLIAPNAFGNPGDGSYLPDGIIYEYGVYVGIIPLIGAVLALGQAFGRNWHGGLRRDALFWGAVLLVAVLLALGKFSPLFMLLYRHVPTFDMFQAPVRWHLWTVFALSVLGGLGADRWLSGKWAVFWTRLFTAGALGMGVLTWVSRWLLPTELAAMDGVQVLIHAMMMTSLWVTLTGGLTLLSAENLPLRFLPVPNFWERLWTVFVWVVLACDLGWAARGLNPTVPAQFYNPLPADTVVQDALHRAYWTPDTLNLVMYGQQVGADGTLTNFTPDELGFTPWLYQHDYGALQANWQAFRASGLPNLNLLDRVHLLNNNEPLVPASYRLFTQTSVTESQIITCDSLCNWNDAAVNRLYTRDGVYVLGSGNQRVELLSSGEVRAVRDGYNSVEVELANVTPGDERVQVMWLMDMNVSGWQVTVNGLSSEIIPPERLPYARGVRDIPVGDSLVRFEYHPWWVLPGALVSLLSVALFVVLLLVAIFQPLRRSAISE